MFQPSLHHNEVSLKPIKLNEPNYKFELQQLDFFVGLAQRHWKDKELSVEVNKVIDLIKARI